MKSPVFSLYNLSLKIRQVLRQITTELASLSGCRTYYGAKKIIYIICNRWSIGQSVVDRIYGQVACGVGCWFLLKMCTGA